MENYTMHPTKLMKFTNWVLKNSKERFKITIPGLPSLHDFVYFDKFSIDADLHGRLTIKEAKRMLKK